MNSFDDEIKIVESTKRQAIAIVEEICAHMLLEHCDTDHECKLVEGIRNSITDSIATIRPNTREEGTAWAKE